MRIYSCYKNARDLSSQHSMNKNNITEHCDFWQIMCHFQYLEGGIYTYSLNAGSFTISQIKASLMQGSDFVMVILVTTVDFTSLASGPIFPEHSQVQGVTYKHWRIS